jgi:hypothetical protein
LFEVVHVPSNAEQFLYRKRHAQLFIVQLGGQLVKVEKLSFEQFVPQWKKGYADQNMGEYTRHNTMAVINLYLIPAFGAT